MITCKSCLQWNKYIGPTAFCQNNRAEKIPKENHTAILEKKNLTLFSLMGQPTQFATYERKLTSRYNFEQFQRLMITFCKMCHFVSLGDVIALIFSIKNIRNQIRS